MAVTLSYALSSSSTPTTDSSNSANTSGTDAALPGRDIQLDYVTKRWALTNKDFTLTRGQTAIKQRIDLRLNLFLGEYFPDVTEGTPWYEQIFVKPARPALVNTILRDRILGVPGVIAVNSVTYTLDPSTREANFEYDVLTDVGQIISSTGVNI